VNSNVSTKVRRIKLKEVRSTVHIVSDAAGSARLESAERTALLLRNQFDLGTDPQETLVAVYLTTRFRPIAAERISRGTVNLAFVDMRAIVRGALLSNAVHVTIAHNHPSGETSPSPDDIDLTTTLRDALDLFGVELHDHIIVTGERYFSMAERGFLKNRDNPK
jgi:DNA repair protein RadC